MLRTARRSTVRRIAGARPLVMAALAIAASLPAAALAQDRGHPATVIGAVDYAFDAPDELTAGWHTITLQNKGTEAHHVQFARLNDDVTPDQLLATMESDEEAALQLVTLTGGVGVIVPGQDASVTVDFTQPGTYMLLCFVSNAEGVPHLALGMVDTIEVVGEAADAEEPTADIEVHMKDFGFTVPSTVPAGLNTWQVVNDGPQPHEMNVIKLNDGVTFDDFMAAMEAGGEGEMPGMPIGGAQGLQVGLSSYIDWDLEPGEYVAICYIPDSETGQPHFALGMVAGFTVEAAN